MHDITRPTVVCRRPGQKAVLVVGADQNLAGRALAIGLRKAGYFVICGVRNTSESTDLQKTGLVTISMDELSTASVASAVSVVSSLTGGQLDILVNNVGFSTHLPALDHDIDGEVTEMFNVNVLGIMRIVKEFSVLLIRAQGVIVNINSIAPLVPLPFSAAYNATKAALYAYSDALQMELAPFRVKVVTIVKGNVATNLVRNVDSKLPEGSLYNPIRDYWWKRVNVDKHGAMSAEDFAHGVVKMLSREHLPTWYWKGASAMFAWIAFYVLPRRMRMRLMSTRFGLTQLVAERSNI